jgi:hypothetical protein
MVLTFWLIFGAVVLAVYSGMMQRTTRSKIAPRVVFCLACICVILGVTEGMLHWPWPYK